MLASTSVDEKQLGRGGLVEAKLVDRVLRPNHPDIAESLNNLMSPVVTQMPRKSASPNMYLEKEDEALNLLEGRMGDGRSQKMYGAACRLAAPKAGAEMAPADLAH